MNAGHACSVCVGTSDPTRCNDCVTRTWHCKPRFCCLKDCCFSLQVASPKKLFRGQTPQLLLAYLLSLRQTSTTGRSNSAPGHVKPVSCLLCLMNPTIIKQVYSCWHNIAAQLAVVVNLHDQQQIDLAAKVHVRLMLNLLTTSVPSSPVYIVFAEAAYKEAALLAPVQSASPSL